jgi:orotidine-5'-phosphate decarboxylase
VNKPLIIALDYPSSKEALSLVDHLPKEDLYVKVGMELYYKEGQHFIEQLKDYGCSIFLDLKCHDIPNTVMKAMKQLAQLDANLINVHAAGGKRMLEASLEGLYAGTPAGKQRPTCIAVTQLTSTTNEMLQEEIGIKEKMETIVTQYAKLTKDAGLDGVVCSALDVPMIKAACGEKFLTVTPGIRRVEDQKDDQHRVVTPSKAAHLGSDAIVVGRSITKATNPLHVYNLMRNEWKGLSYETNNC